MSTDPQEELITVVGPCVAVTLYDKRNHIGGLVHIVLPGRRTSRRADDRIAYYADTGVQLLIEKMLAKGAQRENLVSNVIGGSSQLGLSEEDSIGRRNGDVAISILKKEGIHIQKKDVGGSSGCKILLDVAAGKVDVQKSPHQAMEPVVKYKELFEEGEVNQLIRQIERLKPDEGVAGKLLETVHEHASSTQNIQDVISKDFALVCHILRMCNSTYYGLPNRISSFPDAIRLLGKRHFRLICVVAGTMRRQENASVDLGHIAENFNHHSYVTALIARVLALRASPNLKEDVYSAGLLHSIGKFGATLLLSKDGRNELLKDNSDVLTRDSNAIGEIILTKWNIPDKIIRAAVDFHNPPEGASDQHKLAAMVHVACGLGHLLGVGFGKKMCVNEISPNILSQAGLPDDLESLLPAIFQELRSAGLIQKTGINRGDHH